MTIVQRNDLLENFYIFENALDYIFFKAFSFRIEKNLDRLWQLIVR